MRFNCIGFDLDDTLWDHRSAVSKALSLSLRRYTCVNDDQIDSAVNIFKEVSKSVWREYERGEILYQDVELIRFSKLFEKTKLNRSSFKNVIREYNKAYIQCGCLIDGAMDVLEQLYNRYSVVLITNGASDIQRQKIAACNIGKYFDRIIISEEVGYRKPDPRIYNLVDDGFKYGNDKCIYVGDDYNVDVVGAVAAKWNAILVCANGPDELGDVQTIRSLRELLFYVDA